MKRAEWKVRMVSWSGDARRDDLAPARPAGHEMRLDQAGGDAQIRLDEPAVELDRRAPVRGEAEIDVIGVVARIMVLDPNPLHHPGVADEFGKLFADVRPMQAGGDQNADAVERNAGGDQGFDHRPQEEMVGHRAGDVANQDAGASAPASEFGQRRGLDRFDSARRTAAAGSAIFRSFPFEISVTSA